MNDKIHANNVQSHFSKFTMILNSKFQNPMTSQERDHRTKKALYTLIPLIPFPPLAF